MFSKRMFEDRCETPEANWQQICVDLGTIVRRIGASFHFRCEADRGDAEGNALVDAISAISEFEPGGNAFSYFSTVVLNSFRHQHRDRGRARRREVTFTDYEAGDVERRFEPVAA